MALISTRNIVQFAFLAVPLLALNGGDWWKARLGSAGFVSRFGASARTGITWPYAAVATSLLVGLATAGGKVGGVQLIAPGFRPDKFPVAAVEWARSNEVGGRLFNEFMWGGYLLYAWPETKVFIDGGSDAYGGQFLRAYGHVVTLQPGWRDSLDVWRIDTALLPRDAALTSELMVSAEWAPVYCDQIAVMLLRPPSTALDSLPRVNCAVESGE
jgi:hypothetical protein